MRQFIAALVVAMVVFLIISGTRVRHWMDAPNRVEFSLGVKTPSNIEGSSPLHNVEVYPGFVKVEFDGDAGNPENWLKRWYRRSDVKFEQSWRSLVRWESGQLIIEHQQPLSHHGENAFRWEVMAANVWSLQLAPAIWALLVGALVLLLLANHEHNRLLDVEEGHRKVPHCRHRHA